MNSFSDFVFDKRWRTLILISKILVPFIAVFIYSSYSYSSTQYLKVGSCGQDNIAISYLATEDYFIGCEAIAQTKNFFRTYGYAVDVPIHIFFNEQVTINDNTSELSHEKIHGIFNPKTMSIQICSLASSFVTNSQSFYLRIRIGEDPDSTELSKTVVEEFHRSVITHEVTHLLAQHNFNLMSAEISIDQHTMGHGVQEYIASVVQLSSIDPTLRWRILQQYDPQIIFDHEEQINYLFYAWDPQIFLIMSFRHFQSLNTSQQKDILDRIFSNEFNPDLSFEFEM
ncbi:MAG: hypothetical protein GY702_16955 [Desulfobulbaceae bacterium]|nr:hypothetical protein [Desulfobulbaceae bacterium]